MSSFLGSVLQDISTRKLELMGTYILKMFNVVQWEHAFPKPFLLWFPVLQCICLREVSLDM